MSHLSAANHVKSYVLRAGRKTDAQKRSYDSLASKYSVPFENNKKNFSLIFGNENPVIAEIGFGMGAATAAIAADNPDKNYLGIEVHKPGIGKLLWEIDRRSLANIRIIEHDAAEVFCAMISAESLDGIHIFFPDPWPKKRHHKRRLIKPPFTEALASSLKPRGYLYICTDWEDYAHWALAQLSASDSLANACEGFALPQPWRPKTAFELKGLKQNHTVRELFFVKEK